MTLTLSAVQVRCFLHHLHIIPVSRGYTRNVDGRERPRLGHGIAASEHCAQRARSSTAASMRHFTGWTPVDDLIEVTVERPGFDWFPGGASTSRPASCAGRSTARPAVDHSATVTFDGSVLCAVHRVVTMLAGPARYDWRTGARLPPAS